MTRVIIPGVSHMAITNLGDGSCGVSFFSSQARAERYMENDPERYCDDIIDISSGVTVDPIPLEDEMFATVVCNFVSAGDERRGRLAKFCETSLPTVSLWCDGHNLPHPALRGRILDFIKKKQG